MPDLWGQMVLSRVNWGVAGDLTVQLDDGDQGGAFGAKQTIILGHPESDMSAEGLRGFGHSGTRGRVGTVIESLNHCSRGCG
jgi:hypothetical protein